MIVKIFGKSKGFGGVRYNTKKMDTGKGELVKVSGFDALKGLGNLRPEDYVNYLSALSSRSSRTVYPQFHAMISAKGKSMGKEELALLAQQWLMGMGYGEQPYLLVFHNDTANNHIHMVSTRVGRDGKKISDRFEKIRAYQVLNSLLEKDEKKSAEEAISRALGYRFSTRAHFMMLLERNGYGVRVATDVLEVSKFGNKLSEVGLEEIEGRIAGFSADHKRKSQLRAIFQKYRANEIGALTVVREKRAGGIGGRILGYSSALSRQLSRGLGLEFVFHFKDDKPPYGYTIIDHATGQVFKGSEVMPIALFGGIGQEVSVVADSGERGGPVIGGAGEGVGVFEHDEVSMALGEGLGGMVFDVQLSDDIDDEQILGRNRRRQKKARTNTR